uniref:Uncharacterized protein n=1 Tax=Oryza rufipogon TaxID=4529 RepID=A0A0E0PGT8_ORYRU
MARAPTMVIQEDYIDMDLTPTTTPLPPSSPRLCGGGGFREFEFHSSGAVVSKAFASPADELFYKGNLLPLHLPPRLQLVQKLLQEQQVQVQGTKKEVEDDDMVDMSKVCAAKKYSWSKRLKLMKRWTSREYIKSLFLATAKPTGIAVVGGGNGGGVMDQEELCGHRKSFSGIIRRVRLVATKAASASAPGTSPLCSTSSSSSSTPSCGNASRFFPAAPALKRSSSAGSSEEGAIQGAIAHCKRSQHQHLQQQRRSVSDVVFYSVTNTPRVSSVAAAAAGEVAQGERQEMCRG